MDSRRSFRRVRPSPGLDPRPPSPSVAARPFFIGYAATPRYRATAVIEIHKDSHGAFGLDNTIADRPSTEVSDSFDDNLTLQTEVGILQSDALTLDVIRRLQLEPTPDYFAPHPAPSPALHNVLFWRRPLEPLSRPLAEAPDRRFAALKIFAAHRKISPQPGTRLIAISYSDPSPRTRRRRRQLPRRSTF